MATRMASWFARGFARYSSAASPEVAAEMSGDGQVKKRLHGCPFLRLGCMGNPAEVWPFASPQVRAGVQAACEMMMHARLCVSERVLNLWEDTRIVSPGWHRLDANQSLSV